MAVRRKIKRNLALLLMFTFVSVGLFFALLETSSRDIVKRRNVFGSLQLTSSNLTTMKAPLGRDRASYVESTEKLLEPEMRKRQILLIVAHGRSGSTFLADIFNKHPRVFYVFEPLHGIGKIHVKGSYDEFAMNFLHHIFQCNFSIGNTTQEIGWFFRFYSRALSSPPFCKYKQADPRWRRKYCLAVKQQDLEHACKVQHDTVVYKLLLDRIPGQSIEKLFNACEMAEVECKVIYLIRDLRPVVMSSEKVLFFKEVNWKTRPSMRRFVYSCCEMIEMNLQLVKNFQPSLRNRVRLVRYEDLAVEPLEVLDSLYKFAGLEMIENIKQWIVNITQPSFEVLKAEGRHSVSMVRNSLEVLNKWRLLTDPCYASVIERYCRDVMKLMGYIATEGSVEMLRNLETPLFTENYPAQNWTTG